METLTEKQRSVIDMVLAKQNVFMTGGAGVGKSHVLKCAVKAARDAGMKTVVTASTGAAADQIGGTTLHSQLGLGLAKEPLPVLLKKARTTSKIKKKWARVDLLVIDEVSMVHPDFFEVVDQVLRAIYGKPNSPFGGIALLLSGDFCQLPPVMPRNRPVHLPKFAFQTNAWEGADINVVDLKEIFRQAGDPHLAEILSRIRFGQQTMDDLIVLRSRLDVPLELPDGIEPTRMYSRKDCVDAENDKKLREIPETEDTHIFNSSCFYEVDSDMTSKKRRKIMGGSGDIAVSTKSQKQTMLKSAMTQVVKNSPTREALELRTGAQVMLLTNLDIENGLVNGSRGVVVGFTTTTPVQPIVKFASQTIAVERYTWEHVVAGAGVIYYRQTPLRLAYAITIHKAQGMSVDFIELSVDRSVFECGQAYVALSRATSLHGMRLLRFDPRVIRQHPDVLKFYDSLEPVEEEECLVAVGNEVTDMVDEAKTSVENDRAVDVREFVSIDEFCKQMLSE